jgi:hypothetical protein
MQPKHRCVFAAVVAARHISQQHLPGSHRKFRVGGHYRGLRSDLANQFICASAQMRPVIRSTEKGLAANA